MKRLKYFPTQDYSFLLDENHYVYDHVENEDSLHISNQENMAVAAPFAEK